MSQAEKVRLRQQLLAWRGRLSDGGVQERSRKIIDAAFKLVPWDDIKKVHVYMPITKTNEVDTWPLVGQVRQQFPACKIAVPVMQKDKIVSTYVTPSTTWHTTDFGIPEPTGGAYLLPTIQFDVIFVPMLGFTNDGYRLGYGGGYYDKFLASQTTALTIGLCYDEGRISFIPEGHDIPLKLIVTDRRIYRASRIV